MKRLIYIVTDDANLLYTICDSQELAEQVIAKFGNEEWSIDAEEMC